ncbi:monocarboxylate transporter 13 [Patella vulgata]|uniref:monocarboxylate transporter 13 n=1 Tax=Patella vulgata TaxID=6465 RepID=UPI002180132D|nr:monocarboxylate transporter 13 [Patella vulgata]
MEGGRWGLVIVFAAFMIQFITFGTSFAMGVYAVEFLDYFKDDAFAVSFILSINLGVFLGSGPLVGYLMTKFSHRLIVLVGGVMSTVGLLMIPILPYLPALYIFYGLLNGLGCCMSYTPSHVLSGLYYNKYQSLSTGVATSGSGLGSAVMPILAGYLIEEFTWKGSLYIISGINLHVLVFGALLRPVPQSTKTSLSDSNTDIKTDINNETKMALLDIQENKNSTVSVNKTPIMKKVAGSCLAKIYHKHLFVFQNFGFVVYCINNICWNCSCAITVTFIPDYLVEQGVERIDAAFIVTITGLGTFIGGVAGAILGNVPWINRLGLFSFSNIVFGVCCFIFVWISDYVDYLAVGFVSGFMFGITLALLLVLVTDFLGMEHLGHGLGYLLLANGIGAFAGPPIAGKIEEVYGSYEPSLYTAGVICVIGGCLLVLMPIQKALKDDSRQCKETEITLATDV